MESREGKRRKEGGNSVAGRLIKGGRRIWKVPTEILVSYDGTLWFSWEGTRGNELQEKGRNRQLGVEKVRKERAGDSQKELIGQ